MIELDFLQFHEKQYQEDGYDLYVLRNNFTLELSHDSTNTWLETGWHKLICHE